MQQYDLVVVGTGVSGSGVATRCAEAGWRVAIVDDEPYGGTCELRGCDPKRVLAGVSELVDWQRRMVGRGVSEATTLDWAALMKFKRTFTEPVPAKAATCPGAAERRRHDQARDRLQSRSAAVTPGQKSEKTGGVDCSAGNALSGRVDQPLCGFAIRPRLLRYRFQVSSAVGSSPSISYH
jgi:glutathione reductase (NADPH)